MNLMVDRHHGRVAGVVTASSVRTAARFLCDCCNSGGTDGAALGAAAQTFAQPLRNTAEQL